MRETALSCSGYTLSLALLPSCLATRGGATPATPLIRLFRGRLAPRALDPLGLRQRQPAQVLGRHVDAADLAVQGVGGCVLFL